MDRLCVRDAERQRDRKKNRDRKTERQKWRKGATDVVGPRAIQVIMV